MGDTICFNVFQKGLKTLDLGRRLRLPRGRRPADHARRALRRVRTPPPRRAATTAPALVVLRGAGIRRGAQLECTNLDIAPTILHLLGLPIPAQ